MKLTRALIACGVAAIAAIALLTGCEELLEPGDPCEVDADCDAVDNVCFDQVCTPICEGPEDCADDEVCEPRPEGEESVCIFEDDGNDPDPDECQTADDCDGSEICDDGQCVDPDDDDLYNTVLIEDRTAFEAPDRCTDETPVDGIWEKTGGIKIMWAALYDDGGNLLAYADYHDYHIAEPENADFGFVPSVFDGTPPDLDADGCPSHNPETGGNFYEDAMVALGCDGWLTLQFRDEDESVMRIFEGDRIDVGEYGPQCNPDDATFQSEHEAYDVSLCTHDLGSNPDQGDLNEHCDVLLGQDASGFSSHDVSF